MADQKAVLDKHLSGAAAGNAAQPRADALNAIATLSADNKNKAGFWAEVNLRKVLVEAADAEQLENAREPAIRALANLASDASNKAGMWAEDAVRLAITAAGADGQPAKIRE